MRDQKRQKQVETSHSVSNSAPKQVNFTIVLFLGAMTNIFHIKYTEPAAGIEPRTPDIKEGMCFCDGSSFAYLSQ